MVGDSRRIRIASAGCAGARAFPVDANDLLQNRLARDRFFYFPSDFSVNGAKYLFSTAR